MGITKTTSRNGWEDEVMQIKYLAQGLAHNKSMTVVMTFLSVMVMMMTTMILVVMKQKTAKMWRTITMTLMSSVIFLFPT